MVTLSLSCVYVYTCAFVCQFVCPVCIHRRRTPQLYFVMKEGVYTGCIRSSDRSLIDGTPPLFLLFKVKRGRLYDIGPSDIGRYRTLATTKYHAVGHYSHPPAPRSNARPRIRRDWGGRQAGTCARDNPA
ncbi:hypothetical protein LX32DRAFT_121283 [Colletotrichum zoysiae]|uniref:Uncharacterized protein n=1 Tax=Colletotrichum zoysiae TaxID=1216348 RepID=A0AAD9LWS6_9PEZI|nr:hypothetical protein LX32DRAFT_121283 [Colletotrichum zoysiae]